MNMAIRENAFSCVQVSKLVFVSFTHYNLFESLYIACQWNALTLFSVSYDVKCPAVQYSMSTFIQLSGHGRNTP